MSAEQNKRMNAQMKSALESHPKSRLLEEIRKNNVKGYSKLSKPELIKLMMNERNIEKFRYIKDARLEKALKREEEKDTTKPAAKPEPKKEKPKPEPKKPEPKKPKQSRMEKIGEMKIGNEKVKDISKKTLFRLNRDIYLKYYGKDVPYQNFLAEEKKREQDKPNRLALEKFKEQVREESQKASDKKISSATATARINKLLKKLMNDYPNITRDRIFVVMRNSLSHHKKGFPGEYIAKNYPSL